jgi:hypothetical protein
MPCVFAIICLNGVIIKSCFTAHIAWCPEYEDGTHGCYSIAKLKLHYNNIGKLDRVLANGHRLHSHLGHLRAKIGPGTLRP